MFNRNLTIIFISLLFIISLPAFASDLSNTKRQHVKGNNNKPTAIISGYSYHHHSTIFASNRRYMVSLPEDYYASNRHYPSLFVIDGDFQFQHTSALVTNLARMGKIPPMIVIGVANQGSKDYVKTTTWEIKDAKKDMSDYGGADKFSRYLQQELLPIIDHDFRTNNKKALAGYSLGGLFTIYEMMQNNTPFTAFLAMSPSAWFDDYALPQKLTDYVLQTTKPLPNFFISVANEEEMGVDKTVKALEKSIQSTKNDWVKNWQWQFKQYPNESHFSTAMPALYDGLTFLSPNFYLDPDAMMKLKNYKQVLAQFKRKKNNWAGFQFEWVQAYKFAQYIFWSKQTDQVDQLLREIQQDFPKSLPQVTIQLAKGFIIKKQAKRAIDLLNTIKTSSINNAQWHHQMSLALQASNQKTLAKQHQQKALKLADIQKLSSWLVWELKE